jgi:translation elongation factor EF-G
MRLHDLDKTSIKYYLSEDLKKDSALNEHWDRIDNEFFKPWQKYLNEATLTPDQINQMFAAAEKETSAGGGNSSLLGKIVDKVIPSAFLSKLEKSLPEPDPNAQPDPEFEAKATAAVQQLQAPAETKTGLMAIVKAAVKNPQVQAMVLSLVGGVLGGLVQAASPLIQGIFPGGGTAVVAITGAIVAGGVAIAAAKLQGKGWKEAFKGAIKPALAGAAGAVIGSMAAQFVGGAVNMAADAVKGAGGQKAGASPDSDYAKDMRAQGKDPNDPDGSLRAGLKGNTFDNDPDVQAHRAEVAAMKADAAQLPTDTVKNPDGSITQRGAGTVRGGGNLGTYPDGTPKMPGDDYYTQSQAGDFSKVPNTPNDGSTRVIGKQGGVPAGATATDDAGSYFLNKTNPDGSSSQTVRSNADPADPRVMASIKAKQDYYKNDPQGQAEYKRVMAPSRFDSYIPTGKKLSEGQVYLVFNNIVTRNNYLLTEGRLVEGPMDWLKTKAKNLTTKVTADKLNSAWQKAGSPTDSEQLKKFLIDQGVATEVVDKVYTTLKLPAAGTDPAAAPGADPAAPGADPAAAAVALDPKQAETLYAKVKKEIVTLDKKSQKQMAAYLQKQLGTA